VPAAHVIAKTSCDEEVSDIRRNTNSSHSVLKSGCAEQGHINLCKRPSWETHNKGSDGAVRKPSSKISKALNKEERLQKRLEKNRKTAARSRERKKQEMKEKAEEVQHLKSENARLKSKLEVQKRHAQLLREELASFTRGAKQGIADAATEPAAPVFTITLSSVHDTVMTIQHRSAPNSSSNQLLDLCSVLALFATSSHTDVLAQPTWRCQSLQPRRGFTSKPRQCFFQTEVPNSLTSY